MSFFQTSDRQREYAIAIIRVVVGVVFVAHGAQKLFTFGIAGATAGFTQMGIPLPGIMAPLISGLEFFGGIALILGLLTRLAALGLGFNMLGAIIFAHLENGFFMPQGYEFALTLLAGSAALVLGGPGVPSVDEFLARRRDQKAGARL